MQHHVSFALSAAFSHSPSHFGNHPCYPNLSLMSFKKSLSGRIVFGPAMFPTLSSCLSLPYQLHILR